MGTIARTICMMMVLISGWFLSLAGLYTLAAVIMGVPFVWPHVWIVFGVVVLLRMFYPRNVFAG